MFENITLWIFQQVSILCLIKNTQFALYFVFLGVFNIPSSDITGGTIQAF